LLIGGEQGCFCAAVMALLLRQQLIVVLHDGTLHRALYFGGQATF
jgi:hypothetical protein